MHGQDSCTEFRQREHWAPRELEQGSNVNAARPLFTIYRKLLLRGTHLKSYLPVQPDSVEFHDVVHHVDVSCRLRG
jgi:hypothetical protein